MPPEHDADDRSQVRNVILIVAVALALGVVAVIGFWYAP